MSKTESCPRALRRPPDVALGAQDSWEIRAEPSGMEAFSKCFQRKHNYRGVTSRDIERPNVMWVTAKLTTAKLVNRDAPASGDIYKPCIAGTRSIECLTETSDLKTVQASLPTQSRARGYTLQRSFLAYMRT